MITILMAEDDADDRLMTREAFQECRLGNPLLFVSDGEELMDYLKRRGQYADVVRYPMPGLILLDLNMPRKDGREALREIKADPALGTIPVLFLTARDQIEDRVRGLELGADDYLVKPFAFSEFLARVRTLLRRGRNHEPETLRSANLELDLLRRRVNRCGQRIDLTAKEFALLELLLRRKGEVLPRSLIASQVWDMNFDGDTNVIEVAVRRLRVKVDDPFEPKLIHTVRGMGYVLEAMEPI